MGLLEILALIFITLKLMGEITWSWFWVLSPLIPAAFIWILFGSFLITMMIQIFRR